MIKKRLINCYEWFYALKVRIKRETKYWWNVRKYSLHVMSSEETINYILKNNCSIARFGDGEFDMISGTRNLKFQNCSEELGKKLLEVLETNDERLLLCIPLSFTSIRGSNWHAAMYWTRWAIEEKRLDDIAKILFQTVGSKYKFGNAQVTRPYIDWESPQNAKKIFPLMKKLWEGKDILIVEGNQTRLGVGNDLFAGTNRISRIICPSTDAFLKYEEIKQTVIKECKQDEIVIIALGPTATILASELSKEGIQALDIGHLDIEYEWYLAKAKKKIIIENKYVNEVIGGQKPEECRDEKYMSEIIKVI